MTTATLNPTFDTLPRTATRTATTTRPEALPGAVRGVPHALLRVQGGLALAAALLAYNHLGGSWGWFALLFLLPDLSLLGYLVGPRVGAAAYNTAHSYVGPAVLAGVSVAFAAPVLLLGAAIWAGHCGLDRMFGYGLKYATAFGETHLGRVGRAHSEEK